jgi:hypothetical protein
LHRVRGVFDGGEVGKFRGKRKEGFADLGAAAG